MAKTKYDMTLTDEDREFLRLLVEEGKAPSRAILRAKALLLLDPSKNPKYSTTKVAEMLGCTNTHIKNIRMDYGNHGLKAAVFRKERTKTRSSEDIAMQIVAVSKERPPEGKKKWSLSMLCKESVARGIVPAIQKTTMMKIMREYNPSYAEEFKEENRPS